MSSSSSHKLPWIVSGDIDGFFGLAIDNLIQFLLIVSLLTAVLGFDPALILQTVLPGAAISIVLGNIFYALQARKLAARSGRSDVTALPYGINTVSLFAFVFLVMLPAKLSAVASGMSEPAAARVAWQVGLSACLLSGVLELVGATVAEKIRRATPRAALLSTLSGIAVSFIAMDFAIRTFQAPLIAFLPLAVILATYFGGIKKPFGIPGGALAVILGTAAAWIMTAFDGVSTPLSAQAVGTSVASLGFCPPIPVVSDLIAGLTNPLTLQFLVPVILPMGIFNVLGSLQNIESAEAAGDSYPTAPSLAVNGLGSVLAAVFGSCFPTTIYIGHPGWKGLGARHGYSILNGVFFVVISIFGLTSLISAVVPIEAGMAIVFWIGIVITAQAFQVTDSRHAPAVALGLFPALAGWGLLILSQTLNAAGVALQNGNASATVLANPGAFALVGLPFPGLVALSQGFMLTSLLWSATCVHLIDRKFITAALWMLIGAGLAFFGFIHAGTLTASGSLYNIGFATGWQWATGYVLAAAFFLLLHAKYKMIPA